MKLYSGRIVCWIGMGLLMAVPTAWAFENHDRQLHIDLAAGGNLGAGFDAGMQETLKYSNDFNQYYEQETVVFLNWTATAWLKIGVGYKEINTRIPVAYFIELEGDGGVEYVEVEDHSWVRESRPHAQAEFRGKVAGWKWSNRNRFEWRDKEWQKAYLRYRNRLKVTGPWRWTGWKVAPFASMELFFEDDALRPSSDRFDRTRWTAGLTMKPTKHLQLSSAVFIERNKKIGIWTDLSVLQLGAALKF